MINDNNSELLTSNNSIVKSYCNANQNGSEEGMHGTNREPGSNDAEKCGHGKWHEEQVTMCNCQNEISKSVHLD